MTINKKLLYKLPYTKNNNPNGWIEPTTFCQLKCPHCYRGADKDDFKPEHRELNDVINDVDELIKSRNIQNLFIAGGEPLLYPQLEEIIIYAKEKNLDVTIETNGLLLTMERLSRFKELKVTEVIIHLDKYQNRENFDSEDEVNIIRENYCRLFRKVGGVELGFIMPLSSENINDLEVLIRFYKNNADIVKLAAFTLLREPYPGCSLQPEKIINPQKVFARIKELYGLEYCAYLDKTKSSEISWLIAYSFIIGGNFICSVDKNLVKNYQEASFKKTGKYSFISRRNIISFSFIFSILFNESIKKIIKNLFYAIGKPINSQMVLIINTPQRMADGWDLCEGCPDAILYSHKLVPSCLLERVKRGEEINI